MRIKRSLFAAVTGILLLGAGCSPAPVAPPEFNPQIAMSPDMLLIEEMWGAFVLGAQNDAPVAMQMLVLPILSDEELANMVPAVLSGSDEIDWQQSTFHDGENSVVLVAKDGRDIGTWVKDKDAWLLNAPFWH